ncbi:MAG: RES domain-containing protein [Roseiarcus sp.]|uniref:RES family NAD+ phosphorylase n=1 Tax=Roseiarcus sp. TaxID=1969460 RepID=UPI003C272357
MRLRGVAWRAHNPRWAFDPASGRGAALYGGRFNRPGRPTLYASMRFETAWLEAQQAFPFKAQPMTLCGYDVDCEDVVDLTDSATLAALGVDHATLACPWESLADRLIAEGRAGIVAPSFAFGATGADVNAIFWRWGPDPPHQVRVIDDAGRLPKNDASWR